MRQRATVGAPWARLLHLGHKPAAVATMFSVTEQAIYRWRRRYREGGLAGLANQPKGQPQRKADDAYLKAMEEMLVQEPDAFVTISPSGP